MERYELRRDDPLTPLVDAAESGREAVITREGRVVVELHPVSEKGRKATAFLEKIETLHSHLGPLAGGDTAALIRTMRDEERF